MAVLPYELYVGNTPLLIYEILKIFNPLAAPYESYVGSVPRLLYDLLLAVSGGSAGIPGMTWQEGTGDGGKIYFFSDIAALVGPRVYGIQVGTNIYLIGGPEIDSYLAGTFNLIDDVPPGTPLAALYQPA